MARHERSAGFVIYRQSKTEPRTYLLLDYGKHWDLPKGHLEKGEDDLTAARRELREETGLSDIHLASGFRHSISYFFRGRKKALIQKTVVFFLARTDAAADEIVLSAEHEGYAFLPFDAAVERITFPSARQMVQRAEELLNGAASSTEGENSPSSSNPRPG